MASLVRTQGQVVVPDARGGEGRFVCPSSSPAGAWPHSLCGQARRVVGGAPSVNSFARECFFSCWHQLILVRPGSIPTLVGTHALQSNGRHPWLESELKPETKPCPSVCGTDEHKPKTSPTPSPRTGRSPGPSPTTSQMLSPISSGLCFDHKPNADPNLVRPVFQARFPSAAHCPQPEHKPRGPRQCLQSSLLPVPPCLPLVRAQG